MVKIVLIVRMCVVFTVTGHEHENQTVTYNSNANDVIVMLINTLVYLLFIGVWNYALVV